MYIFDLQYLSLYIRKGVVYTYEKDIYEKEEVNIKIII